MDGSSPARPARDKVRAHRQRLRAQGLRPVQLWLPDVRAPAFKAAARRQAHLVAKSRHERRDQDFIDSIGEGLDA